MKIMKTLRTLGTLTITGLAGAAAVAFARSSAAKPIRDRLREAAKEIESRLSGAWGASDAPAEESPEAIHGAEHAMEHGKTGRARAAELGRKPHVPPTTADASLHPHRARRHA